jgi:hypothetical protein
VLIEVDVFMCVLSLQLSMQLLSQLVSYLVTIEIDVKVVCICVCDKLNPIGSNIMNVYLQHRGY